MMPAQGGQMMGQPMPPPQRPTPEQMAMLDKPSWEQVISLMRNNVQRSYRVDIETDSTIAGSLESDMAGLAQVMQAIAGFMEQTAPLVQAGAMPFEAQKEILMSMTRRAKMGMVVEDAIDKIQQPPPPQPQQDPAIQVQQMKNQADAQKFQAQQQADAQKWQMQQQADERAKQMDMQIEQQRLAMGVQVDKQKLQNQMAVAQHAQQVQAQQVMQQNQLEAQRDTLKSQQDKEIEQMKMQHTDYDWWKAQQDNDTKLQVAKIGAETSILTANMSGEAHAKSPSSSSDTAAPRKTADSNSDSQTALALALQGFQEALTQIRAPRTVIRGPDGKISGVS